MRTLPVLAVTVALLVPGGVRASSAEPPPDDSIDVTPGREPAAVREQLRAMIPALVAAAVREDFAVPEGADLRTRIHFVIDPSGKIAAQNDGSPVRPLVVDSVVLDPLLVSKYLIQHLAMPAGIGEVGVQYEFRAPPSWRKAHEAMHARLGAALQRTCEALTGAHGPDRAKLKALAADASLPPRAQFVAEMVSTECALEDGPDQALAEAALYVCTASDFGLTQSCAPLTKYLKPESCQARRKSEVLTHLAPDGRAP